MFWLVRKTRHLHSTMESTMPSPQLLVPVPMAATGIHFFWSEFISILVEYFILLRTWDTGTWKVFHLIVISWPLSPFTSSQFYDYTLCIIYIHIFLMPPLVLLLPLWNGYFAHGIFIALKWLIFGQSSRNLIQSTNTTYPFNAIRSFVYFIFIFISVAVVAFLYVVRFHFVICICVCVCDVCESQSQYRFRCEIQMLKILFGNFTVVGFLSMCVAIVINKHL